MDAHGPGELGQPADEELDLLGADHHQLGQLVDDDDDVGKGLEASRSSSVSLPFFSARICFICWLYWSMFRTLTALELLVALLHLLDGVHQDDAGLLGVVDDRAEEMGDALVERELEALGVDEDELDLLRASPCRGCWR